MLEIEDRIKKTIGKAKRQIPKLLNGTADYSILDEYTYIPGRTRKQLMCNHDWEVSSVYSDGEDWIQARCTICNLTIVRCPPFDNEDYLEIDENGEIISRGIDKKDNL